MNRRRPRRGRKAKRSHKKKYPDSRNCRIMNMFSVLNAFNNAGKNAVVTTGSINASTLLVNSLNQTGSVAGSFSFQVRNCPQWGNVSAGWDRFKVNKIHVRVMPSSNVSFVSSAGLPILRVVRDYDDNLLTVGGNAQRPLYPMDIWARRGKEYTLNKQHTISFVPRICQTANQFTAAGEIVTLANATSVRCPWLNVATPEVQMLGLKWAIKNYYLGLAALNGQVPTNNIQFEITFDVSFSQAQYVSSGSFPTMTDVGLPYGDLTPALYYTPEGVYDVSGTLLATPDADGNEVPV